MRAKLDVISEVLETCLTDANKSAIACKSKMQPRYIAPYINSLAKNKFILTVDGPIITYKTTDKGKELLARVKEAQELL